MPENQPKRKPEPLSYVSTEERERLWEKPIRVENMLERLGVETSQPAIEGEIAPKDLILTHDKPFQERHGADAPLASFGVPHAGEHLPSAMVERMVEDGRVISALVDRGTAGIFHGGEVPNVMTLIGRMASDPNRGPMKEFQLYESAAPGDVVNTKIPGKDLSMYQEGMEPTQEEMALLVERHYLPYYRAMMGMIGSMAQKREQPHPLLVIDGHSFPGLEWPSLPEHSERLVADWYSAYGVTSTADWPMFILGTREGTGCHPEIAKAFADALERGISRLDGEVQTELRRRVPGPWVGTDKVFKGVHNVAFFGGGYQERGVNVNAIQLEMNENAYTEPATEGSGPRFPYNHELLGLMRQLIQTATREVEEEVLRKMVVGASGDYKRA